MKEKTKQRKIIWVAVGLVAAGLVVGAIVGVVVALQNYQAKEPDSDPVPSKPLAPSVQELRRIDCIPEAKGGVQQVDRDTCSNRSCIFEESGFPQIPTCFYPEYGYKVVQQKATNNGFELVLFRDDPFPFSGGIQTISFRVEERSHNLLRFTVSYVFTCVNKCEPYILRSGLFLPVVDLFALPAGYLYECMATVERIGL